MIDSPPPSAEWLQDRALAHGIPGVACALIAPGSEAIIYAGEDAAGSGRAVGPDTWFQAASTGKHVTAGVILDLAAKGLLETEAPIGRYVEGVPAGWADRSIGSLMHHTSGLPDYLTYEQDESPPTTQAAFLETIAGREPMAEEGMLWSYSNSNYILLGMLGATLTGKPFGRSIADLLRDQGIRRGVVAASPDWARQANARNLGADAVDDESLERELIGDGDLAFTGEGALAWLRALLDPSGLGEAVAEGLFAQAATRAGPMPYGCGLFVETMGGDAIAHHAGHFDGFTAMLFVNRTRRSGVFAQCNLAPRSTRAIRSIALEALEEFDPGATPLALSAIADTRPDLTRTARQQLLRGGRAANPAVFDPATRTAIERAGPIRGIVDLGAPETVDRFEPVEERALPDFTERRYRLHHPDRIEHVLVRTDADDRIAWAWPI